VSAAVVPESVAVIKSDMFNDLGIVLLEAELDSYWQVLPLNVQKKES